jgi:hypothetical protein
MLKTGRPSSTLEHDGRSQPVSAWMREWGCDKSTVYRRIRSARRWASMGDKVRLEQWARSLPNPPTEKSLARWAREGLISPAPVKEGNRYFVDPSAKFTGNRHHGYKIKACPCEFDPSKFSMPGERWLPVVGWERYYRISNLGRVYSLHQSGRVTIGMPVNGGYRVMKLRDDERRCHKPVHVMVLEAFVGPRPSGYEACHGPKGARDNSLANLRWDTKQANAYDKRLHGTERYVGVDVLNEERVKDIRSNEHVTCAQWADRFGVSVTTIRSARVGRTWKHIDTPPLRKRPATEASK